MKGKERCLSGKGDYKFAKINNLKLHKNAFKYIFP